MNIQIDSISLENVGPSLSLNLEAGKSLGIFGPASSGKTKLLRAICGLERTPRGKVKLVEAAAISESKPFSKRNSPLAIAKRSAGQDGENRIAEALTATRLWEVRKSWISALSPSQISACQLLPVLASPSKILAIDCQVDGLDLWVSTSVIGLLSKRLRNGASLLLASNATTMLSRVDTLAILNRQRIVFAGSMHHLERKFSRSEVTIETVHQEGVLALVEPLSVKIGSVPGGIKAQVADGQQLAAKLLTEGYGNVKSVVWKQPTAAEILKLLIPD